MTDMSVNKRAAILSFILLFGGLLVCGRPPFQGRNRRES
jgi:hypothetical protein